VSARALPVRVRRVAVDRFWDSAAATKTSPARLASCAKIDIARAARAAAIPMALRCERTAIGYLSQPTGEALENMRDLL
jgi:hypothetical protein